MALGKLKAALRRRWMVRAVAVNMARVLPGPRGETPQAWGVDLCVMGGMVARARWSVDAALVVEIEARVHRIDDSAEDALSIWRVTHSISAEALAAQVVDALISLHTHGPRPWAAGSCVEVEEVVG